MRSDEHNAVLRAALLVLEPGDAEARLRWLVNFSQRDLSAIPAEEWAEEHLRMLFILFESDWPGDRFNPTAKTFDDVDTNQRRMMKKTQAQLRECFHTLVRNELRDVKVPSRTPVTIWRIRRSPPRGACSGGAALTTAGPSCPYLKPCPVHSPGRRLDGRTVDNTTTVRATFIGLWWIEMILLSVRLLDEVGAWKLMACPFKKPGEAAPCGRLFIANRRQRYCSGEHARAAAFQTWLDKPERGGTRAKR